MKLNAYSFITALKAVIPFAAKNDVRYYLNAVHLLKTDGGFFVEATDGYIAARVKIDCEADEGLNVVLPNDFCKKVLKLKFDVKERKFLELELLCSTYSVTVEVPASRYCAGQKVEVKPIACRYPDFSRIMPLSAVSGDPADRKKFNADYMTCAAKSAAILANPKCKVATLAGWGATDTFVFEVPTDHGTFPAISQPAIFLVCPFRL